MNIYTHPEEIKAISRKISNRTLFAFSHNHNFNYHLNEDAQSRAIEDFKKVMIESAFIGNKAESAYLLTSDYLIEAIEANEYEFTKDGKLN